MNRPADAKEKRKQQKLDNDLKQQVIDLTVGSSEESESATPEEEDKHKPGQGLEEAASRAIFSEPTAAGRREKK